MKKDFDYSIENERTYRVSKPDEKQKLIELRKVFYWILYCLIIFAFVGPFIIVNLL